MRKFYEKPNDWALGYGLVYRCDHPCYTFATLYLEEDVGLAVVQQRFDKHTKMFYWGPVDLWLADDIYKADGFNKYFKEHAGSKDIYGSYPTVSIRKIMYALKMDPLKKDIWEKFP